MCSEPARTEPGSDVLGLTGRDSEPSAAFPSKRSICFVKGILAPETSLAIIDQVPRSKCVLKTFCYLNASVSQSLAILRYLHSVLHVITHDLIPVFGDNCFHCLVSITIADLDERALGIRNLDRRPCFKVAPENLLVDFGES